MPASGRWTHASTAHGGFDHNAQALRVVTSLEHRYPEFDGLNLTWESLEGIVKHNGPLTERERSAGRALSRQRHSRRHRRLQPEVRSGAVELSPRWRRRSRRFADDIAYDAHDIDDGLRAGLFGVDDLKVMPLTAAIIAEIDRHYPGLDDARRGAELVRELISYLIGAVMAEAQQAACGGEAAIGRRTSATTIGRWSPFRPRSRRRRPRSRRSS